MSAPFGDQLGGHERLPQTLEQSYRGISPMLALAQILPHGYVRLSDVWQTAANVDTGKELLSKRVWAVTPFELVLRASN